MVNRYIMVTKLKESLFHGNMLKMNLRHSDSAQNVLQRFRMACCVKDLVKSKCEEKIVWAMF